MPTLTQIRDLRRDVNRMAPDSLDRLTLLAQRKMWLDTLWIWEHSLEKKMSVDVSTMTVKQLATTTLRGLFAAAFPLILFAVLGGFAAGLAVGIFRLTLSLF